MISYLVIEDFKCFINTRIELNQLTVFAGANGNGKSTSIQALLYLRQTVEQLGIISSRSGIFSLSEGTVIKNIPLNGDYCLALGNSGFIQNRNATPPTTIGIEQFPKKAFFQYEADQSDPKLWLTTTGKQIINGGYDLPIFLPWFYYLNTERIGPRVRQSMEFYSFPHAGWQGEQTAQLIDRDKGYWKIANERKFENKGSNYLSEQVNLWLDFILPGTRVSATTDPVTLSGQVLIENEYTKSEPTIATNIGFGISYVLPIIATGLVAEKDTMFIVENPEAHLHPSAQSKIGRFLAMVAKAGVNVIVETHSDHVINGIQIATAKNEIEAQDVTINYFHQVPETKQPEVLPIHISQKGELSNWPSGFFDQSQKDYAELFKLRKA